MRQFLGYAVVKRGTFCATTILIKALNLLAHRAGFEPTTPRFVD